MYIYLYVCVYIIHRGGHLELWDANMTRCVQRIPPVFNRMTIFTNTDESFHGHPTPLSAPEDKMRYALQLVYYTKVNEKERPIKREIIVSEPSSPYGSPHAAIFQNNCRPNDEMDLFCKNYIHPSRMELNDNRHCQCKYR